MVFNLNTESCLPFTSAGICFVSLSSCVKWYQQFFTHVFEGILFLWDEKHQVNARWHPIYGEGQSMTCFYCSWKFQMTVSGSCVCPLLSFEECNVKSSAYISLLQYEIVLRMYLLFPARHLLSSFPGQVSWSLLPSYVFGLEIRQLNPMAFPIEISGQLLLRQETLNLQS